MKSYYYNLHDLVTIQFFCEESSNIDYFDRRFRCFKSEKLQNCDINIYYNVSQKNKISELPKSQPLLDDIGRRRLGKWQVSIGMKNNNSFDIRFSGNRFSMKYLFYNFLEPIINYVLTGKGHCLVHASCFARGNKAYIVHGYPSSGKTSILMRALKKSSDYLSDEMTIISSSGMAYSYPTPLNFCDYNFKKDMNLKLTCSQLIKKYISKILRIATNSKIKPSIEVRPELLLNGGSIVDGCRVAKSCVIADNKRDLPETTRNILKINQYQYNYFKTILNRELKNNQCSQLSGYWQNMFNVICDFCNQVKPIVLLEEQDFENATRIYENKEKHETR